VSERGITSEAHQAPDTFVGEPVAVDEDDAGPEIAQGTRIVIVRHGEAWCNAQQFVGGPKSCRGLTPVGERQAAVLARRLARTHELDGAAAVWTSELPRAIETAAIVNESLGATTIQRSRVFSERDPGEADGLFWNELQGRYGRSSKPGDDPDLPLSPGGETWIEFLDRAAQGLLGLARQYPGELVVVVAHGGIIDASLIRFLGLPEHGSTVRFHAEHTSLTEWQHTGMRWRLVRYNDDAHLAEPDVASELHTPPPLWVHTEV